MRRKKIIRRAPWVLRRYSGMGRQMGRTVLGKGRWAGGLSPGRPSPLARRLRPKRRPSWSTLY